jgi:hypothetical protein
MSLTSQTITSCVDRSILLHTPLGFLLGAEGGVEHVAWVPSDADVAGSLGPSALTATTCYKQVIS